MTVRQARRGLPELNRLSPGKWTTILHGAKEGVLRGRNYREMIRVEPSDGQMAKGRSQDLVTLQSVVILARHVDVVSRLVLKTHPTYFS